MYLYIRYLLGFTLCLFSGQISNGVVLSLSSGGVELNYDDSIPAAGNVSTASLLVDGVDNLFEYGFYYIDSGGSATRLSDGTLLGADTISYSPATDLGIDISFALPSTAAPDVDVSVEISNTATSGSPMTGSLIFYFDYDLNGGFGNHNASISGDTITVTEPGGVQAAITGSGADAFQIAAFSGLRTSIANGTLLDNSGDNFTNGDFTGAFQWNFDLSAGESIEIQSTSVIPEISGYGVFVGAFAFLSVARRRKFRK